MSGDRYFLGERIVHLEDAYSISSKWARTWLPSTEEFSSGGRSTAADPKFLLYAPRPGDSSDASGTSGGPTITLSALKAANASIAAWIAKGDGSDGYRKCVELTYESIRYYGYRRSEGETFSASFSIDSGSAAGTLVNSAKGISPTRDVGRVWLTGDDADLFTISVLDVASYYPSSPPAGYENHVTYNSDVKTSRPVSAGEYKFRPNMLDGRLTPCQTPENTILDTDFYEFVVNVGAPTGTAYEAMFDPTTVDGAINAANVLKPYTATGADAATVSDISWKSGMLKIKLDPVTAHTGHVLNFIDVDGDVALSLALSGATVDAAAKTLSWTVSSQPWKAGDKMMLRILPAPPAPAAPAGLAAAAGNGSVTLMWSASTDSTITRYEYQVRWAGVGWGGWTAIPGSGPATASHVVTGLTNGTEYRFHLRAVNVSGAGAAAPNADPWYVKATPAAPLPSAPSGLAATAGKGSVRLTWSASTDFSITRYEYQVRWAGVGWGEWTAIPNSGSSTASHVVTGLTGGTEYRFHLRAVNATGAGTVAPNAAPWYVSATPTAPAKRD